MMAGATVAFSGLCIVLVEVLKVPPYAVLLVVGVGMFALGSFADSAARTERVVDLPARPGTPAGVS